MSYKRERIAVFGLQELKLVRGLEFTRFQFERHYRIGELARMWRLGAGVLRESGLAILAVTAI
jgi:hypothetical protein